MDILYLLIPLSAVLVLGILGVFAWALERGQFDDLERHGQEILDREDDALIGIKPPVEPPPKNPALNR
jgi:cbb3-type cytochrome oxidase maturation protein